MALGLIQHLTEMSTGDFLESKERPARKADSLTAICEPIVCQSLLLSGPIWGS
jgi:hypothetical protein